MPTSRNPSQQPDKHPSLKERLDALKNVPPLLKMAWACHRGFFLAIIILHLVQALLPLAQLKVGQFIIDAIVRGVQNHNAGQPVNWSQLGLFVGLEVALVLLGDVANRICNLCETLFSDRFGTVTSVRLMKHAAELDLGQFEEPAFQDQLERARRQTTSALRVLNTLLNIVQNFLTLISLTVALLLYVPWLFIPLVIAVLPSFIGEAHFATKGYRLLHRWTAVRRELDYFRYVGASERTAKEVKLFGLSRWLEQRYLNLAEASDRANAELAVQHAIIGWLLGLLSTAGYYGAYAWIMVLTVQGYRSPMGVFTLGVFTFLAASFRQSRDRIQNLLFTISNLYEQTLHLGDLFAFFAVHPKITSLPHARPAPRPFVHGFEFRNVGYRYPGSERWALRHLSFTLKPGQRLALVGENGSGKTTLVKLLTRLYDPDEGVILLDGVDLREYDLASLRQTMGVIFQDFARYDFLLNENIAVGEIAAIADQARITAAAQRSLAAELIGQLKDGYQQMLGRRFEGGVELSGGEWQKIALARAYFRDSELLVLDEPTAALDARAEFKLFQRFSELTTGKMAVLISHRFSTVRMADQILVLDHGQLIEHGTHEALLQQRGRYAELFELQAAGYK